MLKVRFSPGTMAYKKYGRELNVELRGETIKQLFEKLGLNMEEVGSVLVNNEQKDLNCIPEDGSEIYVIPHIFGG